MKFTRFCCAFLVVLLSAVSLRGQSVSTSQVSGTIRDSSGSVVPDARVQLTQTSTGLVRFATSGTDGSYLIPNLPIGPYTLQVTKEGFRSYVQNGIVLEVSTNPLLNVTLEVGSVSQTVTVEVSAPMVETTNTGVGQLIDQERVVDLPLNGREATQLIYLAGGATNAVNGDLQSNKNYPTIAISVSGGLPNGVTYLLDGSTHNDPFNNLNMPLPFPDALEEFKVETSSLPAQYGQHASAAVNAVTKSGSNSFHGDAFEFVRNYMFNARNSYSNPVTLGRDHLKRNQYGGTLGGPILRDKLFFFAGFQQTSVRSATPQNALVPTTTMMAGNFSACSGSFPAPFVSKQVNPSLFSPVALALLKFVPIINDSAKPVCGANLSYATDSDTSEQLGVGRVDYVISTKQSLYARYFIGNYSAPVTWDNVDVLELNQAVQANRDQSLAIGDSYAFSPNLLNSLHITGNRTYGLRAMVPYFTGTTLGSNVSSTIPNFVGISVSNGLSIGTGANNPGYFNSTSYQVADDFTHIRGTHQLSFGVNYIFMIMNTDNNRTTNGQYSFTGATYGNGYADLLLADQPVNGLPGTGSVDSFIQGNTDLENDRANYIGLYAQDSWRATKNLTVNYGLRWEPFLPEHNVNQQVQHFDMAAFLAGTKSNVFTNSPAGLSYPGDPGFSGDSNTSGKLADFMPRVGVAWDPKGDGKMTVRAGYGIFYDTPQLFFFTRFSNNPPWGAQISLTNAPFANPWANYPGGDPFPALNAVAKNMVFPQEGVYVNVPSHMQPMYLQQWNLSIEKQIGSWLFSATYLGNEATHFWMSYEGDPAVYSPGATTSTTNARRALFLANPSQGVFYSTIGQLDDGGTESYNGLLVSAQHRLNRSFSILANWTYSHCLSYPETTELTGPSFINPANPRADRSNCSADRRHIVNVSFIANSPNFSNRLLEAVVGHWQFSTIFTGETGNYSTVTTTADVALSGIGNQRPEQVLPNIYTNTYSTTGVYLNKAAFCVPTVAVPCPNGFTVGTYSTMPPLNVLNPSYIEADTALVRSFPIRETQSLQFRWEIFNLPNHTNLLAPVTSYNSSAFGTFASAPAGQTPNQARIMQFALKYNF
jgi:Carboxypeptidase regulatory-like domain/TonB dependent receptor